MTLVPRAISSVLKEIFSRELSGEESVSPDTALHSCHSRLRQQSAAAHTAVRVALNRKMNCIDVIASASIEQPVSC